MLQQCNAARLAGKECCALCWQRPCSALLPDRAQSSKLFLAAVASQLAGPGDVLGSTHLLQPGLTPLKPQQGSSSPAGTSAGLCLHHCPSSTTPSGNVWVQGTAGHGQNISAALGQLSTNASSCRRAPGGAICCQREQTSWQQHAYGKPCPSGFSAPAPGPAVLLGALPAVTLRTITKLVPSAVFILCLSPVETCTSGRVYVFKTFHRTLCWCIWLPRRGKGKKHDGF